MSDAPHRNPLWSAIGLALIALVGPASAQDGIVQMSPYEVTAASARFKDWAKVSSPHFVVYSDASSAEVMAVVREMEMMHLAAQHFFGREALNRPPMVFVLPTSGSDWRKLESKGHVEWKVAISDPAHTLIDFVLAHYPWQSDGLHLVWAEMGAAEMEWLSLPKPLWFERGMMGFFETAVFTKDSIALGRGNLRVRHATQEGWLSWQRIFEVTEEAPEYRKVSLHQQFFGQCMAVVQYMLANQDQVWVERLMRWVALTDAGLVPSEAEFKDVFGCDWKTWQTMLEKYLNGGTFKLTTLRFPPQAMSFDILQVDVAPREMRELFILTQILNQDVAASTLSLDAMLAKGLQSDVLRELLVEACLKWKRSAAVQEQLLRLIQAGSANPNVHALAARGRFESLVSEVTPASRFGAEHIQIQSWCRRALELEPRHVIANDTLAFTLALAPDVSADTVAAIRQIYHALSGNASTANVVTALAIAQWRTGDGAAARETCQLVSESKFASAPARKLVAALLKELSPRP